MITSRVKTAAGSVNGSQGNIGVQVLTAKLRIFSRNSQAFLGTTAYIISDYTQDSKRFIDHFKCANSKHR
jgi:hypothetical protein